MSFKINSFHKDLASKITSPSRQAHSRVYNMTCLVIELKEIFNVPTKHKIYGSLSTPITAIAYENICRPLDIKIKEYNFRG